MTKRDDGMSPKELFLYLKDNVVGKDLFQELKETVVKMDGKLDTVIEDHGPRLKTVEGKLELYQDDRKWFITSVVGLIGMWLAAMIAVLVGCIESRPGVSFLETEIPNLYPTASEVHVPTEYPTATATPTLTPAYTIEPEFRTPTPINVLTPWIFEVTPLGGYVTGTPAPPKIEEMFGEFKPYSRLNVRNGPGIHFPVIYCCIGVDDKVRIYAWVSSLPIEAWGCMSLPVDGEFTCTEAVAIVYDRADKGLLTLFDTR